MFVVYLCVRQSRAVLKIVARAFWKGGFAFVCVIAFMRDELVGTVSWLQSGMQLPSNSRPGARTLQGLATLGRALFTVWHKIYASQFLLDSRY